MVIDASFIIVPDLLRDKRFYLITLGTLRPTLAETNNITITTKREVNHICVRIYMCLRTLSGRRGLSASFRRHDARGILGKLRVNFLLERVT